MHPKAYQAFLDQMTNNLQADPRVVGLVLLGSTANASHAPDQWSDHDFFVITQPDEQEHFRTQFDWLPDAEHIALSVRETQHGLKILYTSGHLLEYAVFDLDEMRIAKANDYQVVFDRGGVASGMQEIIVKPPTPSMSNLAFHHGMFLCLLVVGAGRVARGEAISGGVFIRTYALGHLLHILIAALDTPNPDILDNLDVYRRFERAFPAVGEKINAALNTDPISSAKGLLEIYRAHCEHTSDYPAGAVETVRGFLASSA